VGVNFCNSPDKFIWQWNIVYKLNIFYYFFLFLLLYELYFLFDVHCEFKSTPLMSNTYLLFINLYYCSSLTDKNFWAGIHIRTKFLPYIIQLENCINWIQCFDLLFFQIGVQTCMFKWFFYRKDQIKVVFWKLYWNLLFLCSSSRFI
jgi:hypothetical protein